MSSDESGAGAAVAQPSQLEQIRNEEYKIWKKQSPFLYDICVSRAVVSPSTSVQWYPSAAPWFTKSSDSVFDTYTLLLSTSEAAGDTNSVVRAKCDLPRPSASAEEIARGSSGSGRAGAGAAATGGLAVIDTETVFPLGASHFPFASRFSTLNPKITASACKDGYVAVFGTAADQPTQPIELKHHKRDVYTLSWSPHTESSLVSAGAEGAVALWDIAKPDAPVRVFAGHDAIGDAESLSPPLYGLEFAPLNANELATAGDDRMIRFWDVRTPLTKPVRCITDAHGTGITSLNYSPQNEMLIATGSADGAVSLWDVRMSSASLVGLQASAGPVHALQWSPHEESVFATGGADAQVKVWDLSMHGQPQTAAEEEEGPPELIFIHGGHLASISDLSWHPTLPWTIASVSEDSLVDVWKIASAIVDAEDDSEAEDEK